MAGLPRVACACMLAFAISTASAQAPGAGVPRVPRADDAAEVTRYAAARDAAKDISRARAIARASHKHVLLLIGGDWCKDCRELDRVFAEHPDLTTLRQARFVLVKVFLGSENRNEVVLAHYPKIDWVPTLIELGDRGEVLRMTPSTEFHRQEKLDPAKIRRYLENG